jgi:uracil-DNA glycosylase
MPMGFCFPGYKNGADAPPRKECAPTWHNEFLFYLKPKITLYVGRYSQQYYLPQFKTLTEAVRTPSESHFVLPHPSGRNNRWLAKNPWFELEILPALKRTIASVLSA